MTAHADGPRPVRLGIIGTGLAVEKLHWPALTRMPDHFEVVAFANHTRPKAEHFADYSGASMDNFSEDYRDLLRRADVDAVLISLPIPLNYPVTRDALEAGKHVFCEKPAGGTDAEGRSFVELAAAYPDRVVLIAENHFYRDDARLARSLLDEGAIGRLHLMSWQSASQLVPREGQFSSTPWRHHPGYVGGPHLDGGIHHIAQLRLLCGDAERVYGEMQHANSTHGGPSDLTLTLRFVNGAAGAYTASYPDIPVPQEPRGLRLYGANGVMALANGEVRIHHADGSMEVHRVESQDGGFFNEFLNFHEAIVHGEPVIGTVTQTFRNMQIVLGGIDAAESGRVTEIDPFPDALSTHPLPIWRPRGATGLFDGLSTKVEREVKPAESA